MMLIKIPGFALIAIVAIIAAAIAVVIVPLLVPESRPYLRKAYTMLFSNNRNSVAREGLGD